MTTPQPGEHHNRCARVLHVAFSAALLAVSACRQAEPAPPPQVLRYLAWTSPGAFSTDLVARFNAVPNLKVVTEQTAGSLVVVSALQDGRGDFGFSQADVVYLAYRRGIEPHMQPHTNLRAIAVRWVNSLNVIVPRDSSIQRIEQLKGMRVGIVPAGSAGELFTRMVLDAHGLAYSSIRPTVIENDQMLAAMFRGALDAVIMIGTPLGEQFAAPAGSHLRFVPVGRDVANQIRARYPFVKLVANPGAERAHADDAGTVGVDSVLVCRKDLSEDVVYQLTKEFSSLLAQASKSTPHAAGFDPDKASATPIPLHPGAARYYREQQMLK
jgi:TRAP transporter TAXI family solute receptor